MSLQLSAILSFFFHFTRLFDFGWLGERFLIYFSSHPWSDFSGFEDSKALETSTIIGRKIRRSIYLVARRNRESLHHPESGDSRRKRRRNRKNGLTIVMILSRWQGHRGRRGLYRGLLLRSALRRTGGVGGGRIGGRRRGFMFWCRHLMMATLVSHKIA